MRRDSLIGFIRCNILNNKEQKRALMKDLSGRVFGKWYVLPNSFTRVLCRDRRTEIFWKCVCSCGQVKDIRSAALLRGESKKCKTCAGFDGEALRRQIVKTWKSNARSRGLIFELTFDQCMRIAAGPCAYCGEALSNCRKQGSNEFRYNGADRVDNSKGYVIDNVVSCCFWCNRAKDVLSSEDFINHCKKVARRFS